MKKTFACNWTLDGHKMPVRIIEVGATATKIDALKKCVDEIKTEYFGHFSRDHQFRAEIGDMMFGLYHYDGVLAGWVRRI